MRSLWDDSESISFPDNHGKATTSLGAWKPESSQTVSHAMKK